MRFLIDKREYDFEPDPGASVKDFRLDASTSVNQLRAHFIEALGKIGEIQIVDETLAQEETGLLCARSDTIFASFHEQPQEGIACRILQHSKGALMLNGGFLDKWFLRDETTNIVTTERQADQLRRGLGDSAPNLGVFVPRIATDCFRMPSIAEKAGARQALEISCADFHMVYAGRWIANKGICQAVRALNHWPIQKARISLVGEFEPNFHISQSNALHVTFPSYFYREVCGRNRHVRIDLRKSVAQRQLSGIFQTADCFFYPSFHEDENFGMAPREAILCGVPSVVTDFCGLSQLGRITKGGLVETYPTLGGVRFSLLALHESIVDIRSWPEKLRQSFIEENAAIIKAECDPAHSLASLRHAAEGLLKKPIGTAPTGDWRCRERINRWLEIGPESIRHAIKLGGSPPPDGLLVDGTGYAGDGWYSDHHFLSAIQAFYTTFPRPPDISRSTCLRGFWRIALWPEERAIVEFGFPGPRMKRYDSSDWHTLASTAKPGPVMEPEFRPDCPKSIILLQELVTLGYLVPDVLDYNRVT